jgi:hypothetical protein
VVKLSIKDNVSKILGGIPSDVIMVAAVKYASVEQIKELVGSGISELGFNTYQQMEEVKNALDSSENWRGKANLHFIGHLQSNKAKKVVKLGAKLIQSVDSLKLATIIDSAAKEQGIIQDILVQVRTDESKEYGVNPDELENFLTQLNDLQNLKVSGLMTIPPVTEKAEDARKHFVMMKELFEKTSALLGRRLDYLSLGMSDDYKIAIEEGANMVRVGRVLFN